MTPISRASAGVAATRSIGCGSRRVYHERGFPVLSAGPTLRTPLEERTSSIQGAVHEARSWTKDTFTALQAEDVTVDIHCVKRWSKLDTRWNGGLYREAAKTDGANDGFRRSRLAQLRPGGRRTNGDRDSVSCQGWCCGLIRDSSGGKVDPFVLSYESCDPGPESLGEVLASTGNGRFCARGAAEWENATERTTPEGKRMGSTTVRGRSWAACRCSTKTWSTCPTGWC
jgi:hypothetical protein